MGATSRRDRDPVGSACFHFYEEGMSIVITALELASSVLSEADRCFVICGQGAE